MNTTHNVNLHKLKFNAVKCITVSGHFELTSFYCLDSGVAYFCLAALTTYRNWLFQFSLKMSIK